MTKTKTAEKAAATAEATFSFGADAIKNGFEKTAQFCGNANEFSKDTAEAYIESATIAGKGIQAITSEIYSYSKQSAADSITAAKAIMAAKSIHEAFALQTDFAKSAFEGYVAQLTKFGELYTATTKNTFAPLKDRAAAFTEVVQSIAAV